MGFYLHISYEHLSIVLAWLLIGAIAAIVVQSVVKYGNRWSFIAILSLILFWPAYLVFGLIGLLLMIAA